MRCGFFHASQFSIFLYNSETKKQLMLWKTIISPRIKKKELTSQTEGNADCFFYINDKVPEKAQRVPESQDS